MTLVSLIMPLILDAGATVIIITPLPQFITPINTQNNSSLFTSYATSQHFLDSPSYKIPKPFYFSNQRLNETNNTQTNAYLFISQTKGSPNQTNIQADAHAFLLCLSITFCHHHQHTISCFNSVRPSLHRSPRTFLR